MEVSKKQSVAILVFANSSREESGRKTILNGGQLFDALTQRTLSTVKKTGIPYIHVDEKSQIGQNFGTRFTNAIQSAFEKGYDKIITIGNDSPQLQVSHLLKAEEQLQAGKFVLGPSTDGGFYLMGLHKSQFDTATFTKLSWQTSRLSKQLLGLLSTASFHVFKLQTLFDIDSSADLKRCLHHFREIPDTILGIVLSIIGPIKNNYRSSFHRTSLWQGSVHHNKGSPLFQ